MANYGRDTGEEYGIIVELVKAGFVILSGIAALNTAQTGQKMRPAADVPPHRKVWRAQ